MEKKYQVFISSTYTDLIEERQEVVEAVLNSGHIPAGMELFKAGPTQEETIESWINESDIYILLLGSRYGSVKSEGISYTEWEYNLAKKLNKPMFSLVLSESYLNNMVDEKRIKATEMEFATKEYIAFKEKVMKSLVKMIEHPAEIRSGISDSIREIEKKYSDNLMGWIKGDNLIELNRLKEENAQLSDKLVVRKDEVIKMQKNYIVKDNYVGEYHYDYVKECLSNKFINDDIFVLELKKLILRKYEDNITDMRRRKIESSFNCLTKHKNEKLSALEYLFKLKNKFLSKGITLYRDVWDEIFNNEIVSMWYQFSLVEKEIKSNQQVNDVQVNYFTNITLSDFGRKFINIYENKEL